MDSKGRTIPCFLVVHFLKQRYIYTKILILSFFILKCTCRGHRKSVADMGVKPRAFSMLNSTLHSTHKTN